MAIQSQVECPKCGTPIVLDSILLLSGHEFCCGHSKCGVSIQLTSRDEGIEVGSDNSEKRSE